MSAGRSIGSQAITALPANRSVILADSRYRSNQDDVYDFECNLSGNAIYAKEIYYQRLFWNQPLFSHNLNSVELRFQMNNNTSVTYVVYATPFLMFTEYDGNPAGSTFLAPQIGSYASNMELGLNGDVRTIPNNTTLVNGDGKIRDPSGNIIVMQFRYSPSKGFAICPVQNLVAYPFGYSIQLLPCSYIANAHYVHGFGVYDPTLSKTDYIPRNGFTAVYYSDTTPTLLPYRYVVVNSSELNKDRRLISFHNSNFANFINELAVFSINRENTGAFHSKTAGEDSTVVSLRDDYTPQNFRIQILNEMGQTLLCDDPIRTLLTSYLSDPAANNTFITGPLQNRGNSTFTNYIVFGARNRIPTGVVQTFASIMQVNILNPWPQTMTLCNNYQLFQSEIVSGFPNTYLEGRGQSIFLNDLFIPPSSAVIGGLQYTGFQDYSLNGYDPVSKTSTFSFYPYYNPQPVVALDFTCSVAFTSPPVFTGNSDVSIYLVMFNLADKHSIGYATLYTGSLQTIHETGGDKISFGANYVLLNLGQLDRTQKYQVCFKLYFMYAPGSGNWVMPNTITATSYPTRIAPYSFFFKNPSNNADAQEGYRPVPLNDYFWGDPLADGLCEEVIHEIGAILEYN